MITCPHNPNVMHAEGDCERCTLADAVACLHALSEYIEGNGSESLDRIKVAIGADFEWSTSDEYARRLGSAVADLAHLLEAHDGQ